MNLKLLKYLILRFTFIWVLFLFLSIPATSQSLEGKWAGVFKETFPSKSEATFPIKLTFERKANNTYKVLTFSKGIDTKNHIITVVCEVAYKIFSKDSVFLEETRMLGPQNAQQSCLQQMHLKIIQNKHDTLMVGSWESNSYNCNWKGIISFRKIKEK